ncbi:MAG: hypothetical protein EOM59_01325 [Clostridia bacterium]|nr:hypothetical protein [Clostridia bacterium]
MELKRESEIIHKIQLDASHFNADLHLKPQAYQMLYCELVDKHLDLYQLTTDKTMEQGLAWVILSLTVEIMNPFKSTGFVYARTWKSGLKGPYFMRDFVFEDEQGNVYFQGTSFSVLLNLETRKVCRDKKLPYFSLKSSDVHVTKGFATWKNAYGEEDPTAKDLEQPCVLRKVENSFIDLLGHVNNIRYGEFIYDAMNGEQIQSMGCLSRMEIYFGAELRLGDIFSITKVSDGQRLYFIGRNTETTEASFHAILFFEHNPSINNGH